jgi:hypothetical protein
MTIDPWVFIGLLLFAVIPAYAFALYGFYIARTTTAAVTKMVEQDLNHSLSSLGGGGGTPLYQTSLSMAEFAELMKKGKGTSAKKGDEEGDTSVVKQHGQYI